MQLRPVILMSSMLFLSFVGAAETLAASCNMDGGGTCSSTCTVGSSSASCSGKSCTTNCTDANGNMDPEPFLRSLENMVGGSLDYGTRNCVEQALRYPGTYDCEIGGRRITINTDQQ